MTTLEALEKWTIERKDRWIPGSIDFQNNCRHEWAKKDTDLIWVG